jgi:hypothetical protein
MSCRAATGGYKETKLHREFEERIGQLSSPKGEKTELITAAVGRSMGSFRIAEIQKECPGVSVDMLRRVLKNLQAAGKIKCLGQGQSARWQETEKW